MYVTHLATRFTDGFKPGCPARCVANTGLAATTQADLFIRELRPFQLETGQEETNDGSCPTPAT